MGGRGSAARFSERYPLLITESCRHTHFYNEFWRKTTHFLLFFANSLITHPCLWKICRKRDPCLENLGPKNPPIWAAHTCTLNMLCTPPPPGNQIEANFSQYRRVAFFLHSLNFRPGQFKGAATSNGFLI